MAVHLVGRNVGYKFKLRLRYEAPLTCRQILEGYRATDAAQSDAMG